MGGREGDRAGREWQRDRGKIQPRDSEGERRRRNGARSNRRELENSPSAGIYSLYTLQEKFLPS